ncbi:MAG: YkgJ family cysteine cluster protein [Verrucomicrobiota bacterium]|nr:YkgJ family cysteine cluster protein [Verrucomicrobiota bacterium]
MDRDTIKQTSEAVMQVYRDLESVPVERTCTGIAECCQFKLTGRTPYLTAGEALVAARAWKATGRKELPEHNEKACLFLGKDLKCKIYQSRPFGCRTHFCSAAGGPYGRKEVIHLIRRMEQIDGALGGQGALPIRTAVEKALKSM